MSNNDEPFHKQLNFNELNRFKNVIGLQWSKKHLKLL